MGLLISGIFTICPACSQTPASLSDKVTKAEVFPGAWSTETYLPLLKGKRVGILVNQTSTIGKTHLIDSLV
ncbi:MAG TPA: hypothetical protein VFF90_03640, partial [Saprospiraceae bacterium]|nr:hypothetical protein [Saprospiraceae bacterium]